MEVQYECTCFYIDVYVCGCEYMYIICLNVYIYMHISTIYTYTYILYIKCNSLHGPLCQMYRK